MEGLYVAATLQVPMLPSLDSRQIEVMPVCLLQALRAHADIMGGAGRGWAALPGPPLETKGIQPCLMLEIASSYAGLFSSVGRACAS